MAFLCHLHLEKPFKVIGGTDQWPFSICFCFSS